MNKLAMFADGFIDEQWSLVSSRTSQTEVNLINKMTGFTDRITAAGSGGVGIELIKKRTVQGGFVANIGCAAASLGVDTTMVGLFGESSLHPVFEYCKTLAKVISIGDPSVTHVLEFDDGKILMSDMAAVLGVNWQLITNRVHNLKEILTEASVIGMGYWSLIPSFDEIIEGMCALIPNDGKERRFFFDFADIKKRDEASLKTTLNLLKKSKIPVTLSVNEHEGAIIFDLFGKNFEPENTEAVRQELEFDELVIHTPHYASAASKKYGQAIVPQEYVEKPVRTAGAGDTFNGGYIAASLTGKTMIERLKFANAAVTFFLVKGTHPNEEDVRAYRGSLK